MLISAKDSVLLVVDVQTRLLPHMQRAEEVLSACRWLVQVARRLEVPVMASEQYPQGLGPTHPDLAALLAPAEIRTKMSFSCVGDSCLDGLPGAERPQVVLCGIESHVCVLQTALDLRWQGKQVFVVAEAVSSRLESSRDLAFARMRAHGVEVVNGEMVAFEWLRRAGTETFKALSKEFLR